MNQQPIIPKTDLYTRVTERIIQILEAGVRPWLKPWGIANTEGHIHLPLRFNGAPYRGLNILLLWGEGVDKGFKASTWMTYQQAHELGAQVRQGETGSLVVYANRFKKTEVNDHGEQAERDIPFLKSYTVFNVEQIDGLPAKYQQVPTPTLEPMALDERAETFFRHTGAKVFHGGNRAFYSAHADLIQLPPPDAFKDPASYTATKAHELIHWTGHGTRCAREFGRRFGDKAYAFEELVAELGAAFVCADLNVTPEVRSDHADYLAHWLQVLKKDKRAIFTAAAQAQRAVDFLGNLQPVALQQAA